MTAPLRHTSTARRRADGGSPPQLRAVDRPWRPARPPRNRRLLALVGGGLLFAAVLGGNVAVQAQTTQGQFQLERLRATARQRRVTYQELRLRVAELEAPQRIVDRAHALGMVEPPSVTYLSPTAPTSADTPNGASDRAPSDEAAQGWASVKPHLDSSR